MIMVWIGMTFAVEVKRWVWNKKMKTNNPFPNNPYFKQACKICEAYTGEEHFYGECIKCPIYKMAEKLRELEVWKSWTDYPERMGR